MVRNWDSTEQRFLSQAFLTWNSSEEITSLKTVSLESVRWKMSENKLVCFVLCFNLLQSLMRGRHFSHQRVHFHGVYHPSYLISFTVTSQTCRKFTVAITLLRLSRLIRFRRIFNLCLIRFVKIWRTAFVWNPLKFNQVEKSLSPFHFFLQC